MSLLNTGATEGGTKKAQDGASSADWPALWRILILWSGVDLDGLITSQKNLKPIQQLTACV